MSIWYWWALAAVLAGVEMLTPGFAFLWLGLAAFLTGVLVWLVPEVGWQGQALAFAVLALAAVGGWFWWRRLHPPEAAANGLNRRADQQVGALGTLVGPLANDRGRVRLGDTTWPVSGPDLPDGARVRVTGARDGRLIVESV